MKALAKNIIEPSGANYNRNLIKLGCRQLDMDMPIYGQLSVGLRE